MKPVDCGMRGWLIFDKFLSQIEQNKMNKPLAHKVLAKSLDRESKQGKRSAGVLFDPPKQTKRRIKSPNTPFSLLNGQAGSNLALKRSELRPKTSFTCT